MQLRFIGTGAAFHPERGSNSAFFERDGRLFLIDCGEQVFARLHRAGMLRPELDIVVVLTHMHADHCGSLATLCLYAAQVLGHPLSIVHPNGDIRQLLALQGVQEHQAQFMMGYEDAGLRITPLQVMHAEHMPAFAFVIEDEQERIYYSGDADSLPPQVWGAIRERNISHAYQNIHYDATTPAAPPPHMLYSDLKAMVTPDMRKHFTLMHANVDFEDIAEADGFQYAKADPRFAVA